MRIRDTEVSAVSAAAAKAARTRLATSRTRSQVIGLSPAAEWATPPEVQPRDRWSGVTRSSEQLADAPPLVDADDRLGDQRRHGENPELGVVVEGALGVRKGDGVGDADLIDGGIVKALESTIGEHPMGDDHIDADRATGTQRLRGADEGASGRDQVVDDDGMQAAHVTDDVDHLGGVVAGTALVDDVRQI